MINVTGAAWPQKCGGLGMPIRPLRPCAAPGCHVLIRGASHCQKHAAAAEARSVEARREVHKRYNEVRDASDSFYKTERWKKLSAYYRKRHPLCECCESDASEITDHIKAMKTHPDLALDWDNLRALCRPCHNRIGERVGLIDDSVSRLRGGEGGSKP